MKLKKAILAVLGRDTLRAIADGVELDGVDRRSVTDMAAALSRRRATPEAMLDYLSETEVKAVCEEIGVDDTGRRAALIKSLLRTEQQTKSNSHGRPSNGRTHARELSQEADDMDDDGNLHVEQEQVTRLPDPPPGMIRVLRTELVWPGKYNDDGTRKDVPRVNLPFQVIETINESRATREAKSLSEY